MTQPKRSTPTPDPITLAIGRRVFALRDGMSQSELGRRMSALGVPWSRVSVEKLENGRRSAVSVHELLALALVFDVPPIMLIADPRHVDQVPVAGDLTVDAWEALLWLTGSGTIEKSDLGNFSSAAWLIQAGWGIVESLAELQKRERVFNPADPASVEEAQQRDDARHRAALHTIRTCVARITAAGAPLPPILPVDELQRRARELEVDLPSELGG